MLSEGFCPVSHGKLDEVDRGWCPDCGLIFAIRTSEHPPEKYITMLHDFTWHSYYYAVKLDWFDRTTTLAIELEGIHEDMARTDDYTQWRGVTCYGKNPTDE
jgi:hypothetical protein